MELTDIAAIKKLCQQYGIRPDTDAGQHFLISRTALGATVQAAALTAADTVVEVGPGFGTLTMELAQRAGRVIAIELDPKLIVAAREILAPYKNVELVAGNFLTLPFDAYKLLAQSYKLVANLPYHITGRFFRKIFSVEPRPTRMVLMVQAEVADRLTAAPGQMSMLAVLCQLHADVAVVARVPRDRFWPAPAVDSAVVRISVHGSEEVTRHIGEALPPAAVLSVAKIGFTARRKTLANNLRAVPALRSFHTDGSDPIAEALRACDLPLNARAQELSIVQWITLAKKLKIYLN